MDADRPSVSRFEDFELDPATAELRKGGDVVALEPQVFDLLALLVKHHDRVVTRDEIIAQVWSGRIVSDSAISSRMSCGSIRSPTDGSPSDSTKIVSTSSS